MRRIGEALTAGTLVLVAGALGGCGGDSEKPKPAEHSCEAQYRELWRPVVVGKDVNSDKVGEFATRVGVSEDRMRRGQIGTALCPDLSFGELSKPLQVFDVPNVSQSVGILCVALQTTTGDGQPPHSGGTYPVEVLLCPAQS